MNAYRVLAVTRRVLLELRNDRRMLGLVIIAPVFAMFVFGTAFSGQVASVPTVVVNQDQGLLVSGRNVTVSLGIVSLLLSNPLFRISYSDNLTSATDMVKAGEVYGVIYFPQNFTSALFEHVQNGSMPGNASVVLLLDRSAPGVTEPMWDGVVEATDTALSQMGLTLPASVNMQPVYGQYDIVNALKNYYVSGVTVFIVFILATLLSLLSFVGEKTTGTLERILATPLGAAEIAMGYAIAFGLLGAIQAVLLLATGILLFGITIEGSIVTAIIVVTILAVVCESLGMLLSSLAEREVQAVQFIPFVVLSAFLLTGVFWPIQAFPSWLQPLSYVVPLTYAADAVRSVMIRGWGVGQIWLDLLVLLIFLAIFMIASVFRVRRK